MSAPTARPTTSRRILVTGGSGFVGRTLVAALHARGAQVTVLDREDSPDTPGDVPVVLGDVADADAVARAMSLGPDAVVHLAAATSVLRSVERPEETFASNVVGTQQLLEACRRHGVPQLVMASSNAVAGGATTVPVRVGTAPDPLTPYGATKAAGEMLLRGHAHAYGLRASILRFSNIYGPGMERKDSIVPRLLRAAGGGATVRVHGSGTQVRDLLHVRDAAAAITSALDGGHHGTLSIGSGRSVSVLELVDLVRAATGAELPVEHVAPPPGEMDAVVVDPEPAHAAIGFRATIELEAGLEELWPSYASTRSPSGHLLT